MTSEYLVPTFEIRRKIMKGFLVEGRIVPNEAICPLLLL